MRGVVLDWFDSYLCNRPQCVKLGDSISDILEIICGVPQGSVLGPILFLIYINDIYMSSQILNFHLFADDTSLFYSHENIDTIEAIINSELSNVLTWLQANKLTLNIDKSNFILFRPPQKHVKSIKLKINNFPLEEKPSTKYLGVILDKNLSWKQHVAHINSKLQKSIGIISKLRYHVYT